MATDTTLRAIITVIDRTQQPFQAINARVAAFSAPLSRIGARLSALAEETGLTNIGEHAARAFDQVKHLGGEILGLAGPLAALGAAGTIAGIGEIVKSAAEMEEQLHLSSIATGIAGQQLAGWQFAAKLANVDTEQLTKGFEYLNRNIAEAANNKSKEVEAILSQMGLHNTAGHLVGTADALKAISAEAKILVDSGHVETADAMMAKLFGARQGAQLLPLFAQGPEQIQEKLKEAQKLGLAPSDADIEQGAKFEESYNKMSGAVNGLKLSIANNLLPALTPIIDSMTKWISANSQWIATSIGDYIKSIDWDGVGESIKGIAKGFGEVFSWATWLLAPIGGVKALLAGLVIFSLAPLIESFASLGGTVAVTAAKFVLFPAAAFLASIGALIPEIASLRDVFVAFDLVLSANPIGAIVLAIGLLGAAAYEIYQHWEPIAAFFAGLWDDIKIIFDRAWDKIKPIIDALKEAINFVADHLPGGNVPDAASPAGQAHADAFRNRFRPGAQAPLTSLPGGGPNGAAGAAGASGASSETKITLDFKNVPAGVQPQIETKGAPDVNLMMGYAWGF